MRVSHHGTGFFRDPEVFAALQAEVLPALLRERTPEQPLRVWIAGCSTGEEAYSFAITLAESALAAGSDVAVQIFATDPDELGIARARRGLYPQGIAREVSLERRQRFFVEERGQYRIGKSIRERCVFSRHHLLTDPPFSQVDLLSCRDGLLSLEPSIQRSVLQLLHFALKPNGILVLGSSGRAADHGDLFAVEDSRQNIWRSRPGLRRLPVDAIVAARKAARPSPRKTVDSELHPSLDDAGSLASLRSLNEELRNLNEELESSNEEIQSSHEEMCTLNEELETRNQELDQGTSDMVNLLASVDTAILMLGPDCEIRRFTPAAERILRLVPADLGRPIGQIELAIDLPELRTWLAEVLSTGGVLEREVQDWSGHWYLLRIRPYRTLDDRIDGAVVLLVDIDRLKSTVDALALADRHKNEFLALVAHELRNPLAPLRNAINLLDTPGVKQSVAAHAMELMNRQIRNMTRLIDDLLDVSRITRGKVLLRKESVDLNQLLLRSAEVVQHDIDSRGQQLTLSLGAEPIYLEADATRVEQVFGNLLHNASKFTPAGGHIRMTVGRSSAVPGPEPEEILVRIEDDGIGISADMLPRIFELFVQAQRSLDRAQGGLGIGLTLVRSLVELHGGTIEARSAGLEKGSEILVRLPLPDQDRHVEAWKGGSLGSPETFLPSGVVGASALGPRRVLVVDDNVDTAESWGVLLRMQGHEVEVAFSGPEALEAVVAFSPEIVLLDIGLPSLNGYDVARILRQEQGREKIVLVALTGYGQEEDRRRALEAGFDHHLTKPVDPEVIYELLAVKLN
jgi:signal transduction histidine kinase/chemotaxis methyl-accepting protein methylase